MKPTVGRIVHYTNANEYPAQIQAAMITSVDAGGSVSLKVFTRNGSFDLSSVPFTEYQAGTTGAHGCWTWPAREAT